MHYYTDGSSLGNPGPSGAGVTGFRGGLPLVSLSIPLGETTNNVAELQALLTALHDAHARLHSLHPPPSSIFFFVDNRYAINVTLGRWKPKAYRPLIAQLQQALAALQYSVDVDILWVPGHAEIQGNEAADALAKQAARDNPARALQTAAPPTAARAIATSATPLLCPQTPPPLRRSQRPQPDARVIARGLDFSMVGPPPRRRPPPPAPDSPPSHCPHGAWIDHPSLPACCLTFLAYSPTSAPVDSPSAPVISPSSLRPTLLADQATLDQLALLFDS